MKAKKNILRCDTIHMVHSIVIHIFPAIQCIHHPHNPQPALKTCFRGLGQVLQYIIHLRLLMFTFDSNSALNYICYIIVLESYTPNLKLVSASHGY